MKEEWQSKLLYRSKQYGTIKFRQLLTEDMLILANLVEKELPAKEFAIHFLKNQIEEPVIIIDELAQWDEKVLLKLAKKYSQMLASGEQYQIKTFDEFQKVAISKLQKFKNVTAISQRITFPGLDSAVSGYLSTARVHEQISSMASVVLSAVNSQAWLNSIVEQQNRLYSAMASRVLDSVYETMSNSISMLAIQAAGQAVNVANSFSARILESFASYNNLENFRSALFPSLPDLSSFFEGLERYQQEFDEKFDQLLKELDESDFELAILVLEEEFAFKVANSKPTARKGVITKKLTTVTSTPEFIQELEVLFACKILQKRWPIVRQGLLAHQSRQYILSIPVLLSQIEGIFTDLLVQRKLAYKNKLNIFALNPDGSTKVNKKNERIKLDTLSQKTRHAKGKFEELFISATVDEIIEGIIPKRNSILHGKNIGYASAKLSTQTVLLIQYLASQVKSPPIS